jgi:uncharacterized protein (DUF1330 family)
LTRAKAEEDFALGFVDSGPQDLYAYACRKEKRPTMPAYFVVQATIKDEPQYQKYREAVVPFMARFGGKLAARGAKVEVLEGEHDTRPVVMFEFPSMEAIRAFWNSPDYVPIKKLREGIATINVWAFPGV